MRKNVLVIVSLVLCLGLCSCINKDIVASFYDVYEPDKTLGEFCGNNTRYELEVEIDGSRLLLALEKNNDTWSGALSYYEREPKHSLIETIPVSVEGDELILHLPETKIEGDILVMHLPETKKKVSLSKISLYRNFDSSQYTIKKAFSDSFDYPLEEIRGSYPLEEITPYMETLYIELYSNLSLFDRKEDYFKSIEQLQSVVYVKNLTDKDLPGHYLSFGFNGDENIKWNPGYGDFENIGLLIFERVSTLS